jgi:hypothetical protein
MPFRLFVRPSNFDECRNFVYFDPLLSVEKMHIFIGIVVLILGFFIRTKLRRIIHAAELRYISFTSCTFGR